VGFWIAVVLGLLMLLDVRSSPLLSALDAGLFFAVAIGIRRGRWWAAVFGAYLALSPLLAVALRWDRSWGLVAVVAAGSLTVAYLMLRTAAQLRAASPVGVAWPWLTATALLVACTLTLRPMALPTGSMEATLCAGDRFLMESVSLTLGHRLTHGELVVFRYPPDRRQVFVKRVVGLPGDRLHIVDKLLYRNGQPVQEPYATHKSDFVDNFRDNFPSAPQFVLGAEGAAMLALHVKGGEVVVPEGHYFVLGDNRDNSLDSRYWGFVARENVIGRPLLLYSSRAQYRIWPRLLTTSGLSALPWQHATAHDHLVTAPGVLRAAGRERKG
jgi:signal peptidase I